jgi:hypothetical protein
MTNLKLNSCYAVAAAAVLSLGACSTGGDSTSPFAAPASPLADFTTVAAQTAEVCKSGPVGTYSFTASNSGTTNTGDVLDAAFDLIVTDPAVAVCTTVFTRTTSAGATDPAARILITELAAPGTGLASISTTGSLAYGPVVDETNRRVTLGVNAYHPATATFYNVAVGGCTFTQGWYKNHTTQWPAGSLTPSTTFDGWTSLINVLNTPPKGGSQYIILAHQYITALLNAQGGASVPADVQTALNTAAAYFAGGGNGTGGSTDITGVAAILDAYNNGITGPGHCD